MRIRSSNTIPKMLTPIPLNRFIAFIVLLIFAARLPAHHLFGVAQSSKQGSPAQDQAQDERDSDQNESKGKGGDKSDTKKTKKPKGKAHKVIKATKPPALTADKNSVVVELSNGDRLTGTGMQITNDQLKMTSIVAGDVTIPMTQIKSFALADKVMVVTKNGVVPADKVSMTSANHVNLDESGKSQTLPASSIEGVYPAEAYDNKVAGGWRPWLGWHGNADAGYTLVGGGGQSSNFNQDVLASRESPGIAGLPVSEQTKFSFGAQMGVGTVTGYRTKVLDMGLGQNFYVTRRGFLFLYGQLDHIYSQQLYLQQLAGGGYGYNLIQHDGFHFEVQAGLLYVHDHFFSPFPSTANPTAMVGETLDFKIGDRSTFHHTFEYEPAVNQVGFYQMRTDSQFTTRLRKALSLHVSLRDLYLSQTPGTHPHKNSITLATGVGVTF